MRGLSGKVAIVTGGATGIGRAIMERLCQEGVSVTFSGISDGGDRHRTRVPGQGLRGAVRPRRHGRGGILPPAGRRGRGNDGARSTTWSTTPSRSSPRVPTPRARMAADDERRPDRLRHDGRKWSAGRCRPTGGGSIVNLSSISAHIAQPNRWTYNAAKGAVNQLTRCMALDLAPYNIRVNTVSPGWIWTREVDKAAGGDRAKWGPIWGKFHMLRRLGEVEECAAPVAFLLERRGQLHHRHRNHGRWRLPRHGLRRTGRGVELRRIKLTVTLCYESRRTNKRL